MATKAALRQRILWNFGVIDETEDPSDAQADLLDTFIDSERSTLLEEGLCWWDDDDIPASVLGPLARIVGGECCDTFGKAGKGHEAKAIVARKKLAALKSSEEREPTRAEYF